MNSKFEDKTDKKPPAKKTCYAHGCPMAGTMSGGTTADQFTNWYCRFHDKANISDFSTVTKKINEYFTLLKFVHRIKTANPFDVQKMYQNFNNKEIEKLPEENQWQYAHRLELFIKNNINEVMTSKRVDKNIIQQIKDGPFKPK